MWEASCDKERKCNMTAWQLFLFFAKTGCVTFGGGWSIMAQIQRDLIEKRGVLTKENLLDFTSVGKSLPGVMICNICYLCGYHLCGVCGGLAALFGVALAPFFILCVLTGCYVLLQGNTLIMRAMTGVRAAVAPIIGMTLWRMQKGALTSKTSWVIMLVCAALSLFTRVGNVPIIGMAAAAGLFIGKYGHGTD